jgi:hypothetical protein
MATIPFASHIAPPVITNETGQSINVSLLTFCGTTPTVTLAANRSATLSKDNQDVFSLPFNAVIENIYVTFNTFVTFTFPNGFTVYPFVQLYTASPSSNTFTPISTAKAAADTGYSGTVQAYTPQTGFLKRIGLSLTAGTRILIGGQMEIIGGGNLARTYYFYFTGGIGLRQV